jgi:hypothetical protein
MGQRIYNFDAEMTLAIAGAVFATAANHIPQLDGADLVRDVGVGRFEGMIVLDVSALDIASNDENYNFVVQGSNSATFASAVQNLAAVDLGCLEARKGFTSTTSVDSVIGRYELPFVNEQGDVVYRYLRLMVVVVGTTPTITFGAFIAPLRVA